MTNCWRAVTTLATAVTMTLVALWGVSCRDDARPRENDPPHVPRIPRVERLEVDRFRLSWNPAEDDDTPVSTIRYEVGVVASDVCVVQSPNFSLVGRTELNVSTPEETHDSPLVGFSVRSIDANGYSRGYGPCSWAMRSPIRRLIRAGDRRPRLRPAPANGPERDCQSDGDGGVWCVSDSEIAHFAGLRWEALPFPTGLVPTAWAALDQYAALARTERLELELSRANGLHAYALSSGSELFDSDAGAISIGRDRAYVVIRGHVGELRPGFIDMAGPPAALRLPRECDSIIQIGRNDDLAYALCRSAVRSDDQSGDGLVVYISEVAHRVFNWRTAAFEIDGDRVDGIIGTATNGVLAISSPEAGWLIRWQEDERETIPVEGLPGEGRPIIAIGGSPDTYLAVATRDFSFVFNEGNGWHPMTRQGDEIRWRDARFPAQSHMVGTGTGVFAISPDRTVRLDRRGAQLLLRQPGDILGVRGQDSRLFAVSGPMLRELLSSRHGDEWYTHTWRGPDFEPHSLATTPSGGIYLSGWRLEPGSGNRVRPAIYKFGHEGEDLTPPVPEGRLTTPPTLATDGRGDLYAYAVAGVIWRDSASGDWYPSSPLPGRLHSLVGLTEGVLAATETADGPRLARCQRELCFEIPVPAAAQQRFGGVVAHENGFCVGLERHTLWCRGDDDQWLPIRFAEDTAARHQLGPQDQWAIVDAIEIEPESWLLAITSDVDGYLALRRGGDETLLLAYGLRWADGAVLINSEDDAIAIGLEVDGPISIRLTGGRMTVPGSIYP